MDSACSRRLDLAKCHVEMRRLSKARPNVDEERQVDGGSDPPGNRRRLSGREERLSLAQAERHGIAAEVERAVAGAGSDARGKCILNAGRGHRLAASEQSPEYLALGKRHRS